MIFEDLEVESDSSPQSTMAFPPASTVFGANNLDTIVEGQEQRPKQLPLNQLPPKPQRTSSQERFRGLPSSTPTPLAGSPRTISTTKEMPFLLQHIHNMSDEDFNRLPEEIYKQYVKERADRIIKEIVPEPLSEVNNCYSQIATHLDAPHMMEEPSEGDLSTAYSEYPRQSTLYPLAKDQLKVGQDGRYFETRNYNRLKDLGEGGFGMVYACLDTCKDNLFAIKCNSQSDEMKVSSIKRECKVMYDIGRHEHITRFLGSLVEDHQSKIQGKSLKMLMECADNGSLDEMLYDPEADCYGLSEDQSLFYLQQILYAVNYLHQRDTLHLDLKCKNILVFDDGRTVKLADFGSAMKKEEVSMKGSPVGFTPHYSAPEVNNNCEVPSCSADIWSVMCVLVEMCTGKMPWCFHQDLSQQSAILMVGHYQESNDFSKLVPVDQMEISDGTLELLKKVLIRNSRDRPTATHLLNDPIIMEAVQFAEQFDNFYGEEEEEEMPEQQQVLEQLLVTEGTDQVTEIVSLPLMYSCQRVSVDSGLGRSLPDRLSSFDSGSSLTMSTPRKPSAASKYQILRHESAPFLTLQPPNLIKFTEITAHFNGNSTIPSNYRPSGLIHSNSAPPDILWNGESRRWISRGMDDDTEKDGVSTRRSNLKRTPSAQYVSNGPEVDSPDGRRSLINATTTVGGAKVPILGSPTANGMVSVGTQTSLSPTIEGVPPFPGPQTINYYNRSQPSVVT